jgi:dipeptidyl aminopeptidase/acylaminoacyl peptidase
MPQIRPYGAWASLVTAASLAEGGVGLADLRVAGGQLYWLETRPTEGGRVVAMTDAGGVRELTPSGFNVRTRVHEYGGAPYVLAPEGLWFSHFRDQKLYLQRGDGAPEPMTPEGYRYADAVPAPGGGLFAVREDHTDPANVRNAIVRLSGEAGDAGTVIFGESDFVAYPRVSSDGRRLAWIAWDFPAMPWDATRLYVAEIGSAGVGAPRQVAGGDAISVIDVQWGEDGTLYWLSDETGFWNLYAEQDGRARAVLPRQAEFGGPLWGLGQSNYAPLPDGRIIAAMRGEASAHLLVIEAGGAAREIELPFVGYGALQRLDAGRVAMLAAAAVGPPSVIVVDVASGGYRTVRRPTAVRLGAGHISRAEKISFPSAGGRTAHALYYPPKNGGFTALPGERPPLIVQAHGGPTGAASPAFHLAIQFWTTRGFALVDVDYGGSSGYGRAYRQLLEGQWGVVDVEDVIAAVRYLAGAGRVDAQRVAIHGGSAGGFTVLAALSQSDVFGAGGDLYGVSDLAALARDTHKFESRYLDGLIGPYPAAKATYEARSPIHHLERFTAPLLILQGAEDPIVPPNQAYMIRDALKARGVPVAYIEFAGEGHGFRRAENIIRAHYALLYFYGRAFGFTPADALEPLVIDNEAALNARADVGA